MKIKQTKTILEGNPTFMCLVLANSGGWVRVNEFKTVVKVKRRKKETRGHSSPNLEPFRSARVPLSLSLTERPADARWRFGVPRRL